RRRASRIMEWMSEQPAETLTRFLMDGMRMSALPAGPDHSTDASALNDGWFLPPLADMTQIRRSLRFIDAGAVVCPVQAEMSEASAITISAVLNFAPLFDESRFEFWLTSDGADRSCPPIDGQDLAMPGALICVGAITRATSVQALSELAASLFRKNRGYSIFWLDLTATGCDCLEDCFVPLGCDCALVDSEVLGAASAFAVRANRHGMALTIEPCQLAFLKEIAHALGTADLRLIDAKHHAGSVRNALNRLAPVVLSPGRVLVFEDHRAAFPVLEEHGIEIVAALDGSALSRAGKGPRGLMSALHAG
ncbi:arginine deiminase family protein, partial [Hoeflea sp.]|uniref:arginine deiminase family protein n=1 Tax=Hoeflea sp. TaxID=1940281 RepID=UPI0019857537